MSAMHAPICDGQLEALRVKLGRMAAKVEHAAGLVGTQGESDLLHMGVEGYFIESERLSRAALHASRFELYAGYQARRLRGRPAFDTSWPTQSPDHAKAAWDMGRRREHTFSASPRSPAHRAAPVHHHHRPRAHRAPPTLYHEPTPPPSPAAGYARSPRHRAPPHPEGVTMGFIPPDVKAELEALRRRCEWLESLRLEEKPTKVVADVADAATQTEYL